MFKNKKIICIFLVCLLVIPLTFINASALSVTVDDVTFDCYSSYFWDIENGQRFCTPYLTSEGSIRFETTLSEKVTENQLYVFCSATADFDLYGTFSITASTLNGSMGIVESASGLFALNSDGTVNWDLRLAKFEPQGAAGIRGICTYEGELPERFLLFLDYNHSYLSNNLSVAYYDLSFELMSQAEMEKYIASQDGNSSVNGLLDIIPDESSGFLDGFRRLTSAMSYNGTESKWIFPALYIPAINGLFDRIELSSEKEIDFSYWCQQIPSALLTLIQYFLTISLILFCFYELYNTISYALTLGRKGGGS